MSPPTADWIQLQDRFYRKQEIYSMLWKQMDLSKYMIAGAPFGGPVALVRDDRKVLLLQKQQPMKPSIYLYTSAGKLMEPIQWDKGRIVGMGWTDTEKLLCVLEDGTVRMFNILGEYTQFSLGKEAKDNKVIDVQFWGSGLVALTGNFQLIAITNFDEPQPLFLADTGINEPPHSWTVIPPKFTLSRHVEVLLATGSTILVVDSTEARDERLQQGPFTKISVSPDGKYLALFTSTGNLWVVSTDFQKNLSEFATKSLVPPQQLVWCGIDSVVLYWDKIMLMVGPFGDWIKYSYDDAVFLIPEIDGVRIISSEKCEFLQKVPATTEDIFKIGSTESAAMLYDALEHFEKKSPKADENIRSLRMRMELPEAVEACIEAAGHEISPQQQRTLLKAASFGKYFLEIHNADSFVNMCKVLRVLNAVRFYEIGIPLTFTQYTHLSPEALIDRLISRHQYLLAIRVCEYLKLRTDRILIHWACSKIRQSSDDEDTICRMVVEKLANKPGLSYSEIAMTAHKAGQSKLATRLLDYEPRAGDQVPLLMSMHEDKLALTKAIESGDTDLVYHVILDLRRRLPLGEFLRTISGKPMACNLLESYSKQQDPELLKDFYYQDDRRVDSAHLYLQESYLQTDVTERTNKLKSAMRLYQDDKEYAFEAKAIDENIKLIQAQAQLEKELSQPFVGLSVSSTVYKLITIAQGAKAIKLKDNFKMPDKRFWWIKLRALVEIRDWDNVSVLAKSKKSPIGYEPFVEECVKANQYREAAKYILRCDAQVRVPLFLKIEAYQEAGEQALLLKDMDLLMEIRSKCPNAVAQGQIDGYIAQLVAKK